MYRDAIESFEKSRDIGGTPSEWDLSAVGQAYARLGNKEKALEILEQIKTSPTLKRMRPTRVAGMYIALGDNDQAWSGWRRLTNSMTPAVPNQDDAYV